jgi:WD40 repeat protein
MPVEPHLKLTRETPRQDILFCAAYEPRSQRLFAGSSDGSVYAFDCAQETANPIAMPGHAGFVTGLALSADGHVLSGGSDGQLIWRDAATRETLRIVRAHRKWIRAVKASPDGRTLASVGDDMVCRIWDAQSFDLKHELRGHEALTPQLLNSMLYTCAFSPDGALLATADRVGHIVVWDLATGKAVGGIETPSLYTWDGKARLHSIGGVRSVAFSPDGMQLAAGGIGQVGNIDGLEGKLRVEIHDWRNKKLLAEFSPDKKGMVEYLRFRPEGDWLLLAGGGAKGFLTFLDPQDRKILADETPPMYVHDIAFDPDHKRLFAVGHLKIATYAWTQ